MAAIEANDALERRCVRLKVSKLFCPDKLTILRRCVSEIHTVTSLATFLIKRFYLTQVHEAVCFHLDVDFILLCFNVVQGIRPLRRAGRSTDEAEKEKKAEMDDEQRTLLYRLEACFARMAVPYADRVRGSAMPPPKGGQKPCWRRLQKRC
jgi:hypothetical protein